MKSDRFRELVRSNIKDISSSDAKPVESSVILCPNPKCGRAGMKPAFLLYDTNLDEEVLKRMDKSQPQPDLLFVVGTSLCVEPFSELPSHCPRSVRVVVNRDLSYARCGFEFGNGHDHMWQGNCEEMFFALAEKLGWLPDLAQFCDTLPPASKEMLDKALKKSVS